MSESKKIDIRTLSLAQIENYMVVIGEPKYRAKQIYEWFWKKNAHNFDEMTNLSKNLREKLVDHFDILTAEINTFQKSKDGTIKNAVELHDNAIVESVLIPTPTRTTACVSSQVGCSLDCTFCATAQLKRMRNLTSGEIVDQVVLIDKQSREYFDKPLSNIVFMGMGEPLLNYVNVVEAVKKITSKEGLGMAARRITLSTSGIPKMIRKLADDELRINLAVSLHTAVENIRNKIMPFSHKFSLEDLSEALIYWYEKTKVKITFEYIVWDGINDKDEDINALVAYCKRIPSKVNLIQYNSIEGESYKQAPKAIVDKYISTLEKNGIIVNLRRSRGEDIDAACGQLVNKIS
jgi:23S rRNA (adenine2503-C2)-methyltransferase